MLNPVSILLIVDDPMEIMKLRRSIDGVNITHNIIETSNGEDALIALGELAESSTLPDFIFMDISMKKINGFDFLKILKSNSDLKNISTVVLTNKKSHIEVLISLKLEITGYIMRHDKYNDYLEMVSRFLTIGNFNKLTKAC